MTNLSLSRILSIALLTLVFSCKREATNEYNPEYWAKKYCECLTENHVDLDVYNARILCDSKLNFENR
ncbi:MAG TPA: hypothetical protein PLS50_08720, partial [Candidatus Dojkabacteria bacterium]|nr:hypothetical protein [Candidatus Dojkabacteria bacterium]